MAVDYGNDYANNKHVDYGSGYANNKHINYGNGYANNTSPTSAKTAAPTIIHGMHSSWRC